MVSIIVVTLLAGLIPAFKASRLNPIDALSTGKTARTYQPAFGVAKTLLLLLALYSIFFCVTHSA